MTINIICEEAPHFKFHYKELAKKVIRQSLDTERFPYEAEVSLTLVNNEMIQEINRDMRNIDAPTDVLSFPMLEYVEPAYFYDIEEEWETVINPDTDEVILGDIVISLDKVRAQAEEYGHSEKREYAFLIVHSMLHLMGYDHMDPDEAEIMEEHQRAILDKLNIKR